MKVPWSKMILMVAALAGIGFYLWSVFRVVVSVEIGEVDRGPLAVVIEGEGKTRIRDRYVVSAPIAGTLRRIGLRPGDEVRTGETLLATIQPVSPGLLNARDLAQAKARENASELAVQQAESMKALAFDQMALAEKNFGRLSKLAETDSVSQQELDQAETDFRNAKSRYASAVAAEQIARFELAQAQAAMVHAGSIEAEAGSSDFQIRSPIHGRVLRVIQESSVVVQPGTPLLELGDPNSLEIELDVLSTDAVKIRSGNPAVVTRWGGPQDLMAVVQRVEPAGFTKISALGVEEQRVLVLLDFVSPFEERTPLGDAYRVECGITIWKEDNVLRVPTNALIRHNQDWAVFRVQQGRCERVKVVIGQRSRDFAQVIAGLEANDQVVLYPSDQVQPDVSVRIANR